MLHLTLPSHLGLSREEILKSLQASGTVTPEAVADLIDQNNRKIAHILSSVIANINDNLDQLDRK